MRAKIGGRSWKHLLYTTATLATMLLAASAHFKPHN
jgi:hypothetical protein